MTRYILKENIALRSWNLAPYAYYSRHSRNARGLTEEAFAFLASCDGARQQPLSAEEERLAERFLSAGLIRPAAEGEKLLPWQEPRFCDNRYFPAINWMITGKCNYNCLHCFNAADSGPLTAEWTLFEAEKLLDEAQRCGVNAFTITGGEPMVHRDFFEIIKGIYDRDMYVEELNTNGDFISQEALDRFKDIGCAPLIKISFDGLGRHDWLRNRTGAEQSALAAISLCIENGFRVKVQTNVHKLNVESMLPTARLLDRMGVEEMRIIRTSEAPRWLENAGGASLGLGEYYDRMLAFAGEYKLRGYRMSVDLWQLLALYPQSKSYRIHPVECGAGEYRDSLPVCRGNRGMAAISADGRVYPCMQLSGCYEAAGEYLGNVKTDGLTPILREGAYLDQVCTTVKDLAEVNPKCRNCRFFRHCAGGCRALAFALTGDKMGCDPAKCLFFEKGYYDRIERIMAGWTNRLPMEEGI